MQINNSFRLILAIAIALSLLATGIPDTADAAAKNFLTAKNNKFYAGGVTLNDSTRKGVDKMFGRPASKEYDDYDGDYVYNYRNGLTIGYWDNGRVYSISWDTKNRNVLNNFARAYKGLVYKSGGNTHYYANSKSGQVLKIYYEAGNKTYYLYWMYWDDNFTHHIKKGTHKKVAPSSVKF